MRNVSEIYELKQTAACCSCKCRNLMAQMREGGQSFPQHNSSISMLKPQHANYISRLQPSLRSATVPLQPKHVFTPVAFTRTEGCSRQGHLPSQRCHRCPRIHHHRCHGHSHHHHRGSRPCRLRASCHRRRGPYRRGEASRPSWAHAPLACTPTTAS